MPHTTPINNAPASAVRGWRRAKPSKSWAMERAPVAALPITAEAQPAAATLVAWTRSMMVWPMGRTVRGAPAGCRGGE